MTCPGVRLSSGHASDAHVCIYVFRQRVCTRSVPALFPFLFYEAFRISQIYVRSHNVQDVFSALKDEYIQISLVQVGFSGFPKVLATYENNLYDFLFPLPNSVSSYSGAEREVLLVPSRHFPGVIGPRLEFSTRTSVHEGGDCSPYLLDTHLKLSREWNKRSTEDYVNPENIVINPHNKEILLMEDRPPFVVRRVDSKLFSRKPSLYKEYEGPRFYCCQSPHRCSKCAACRFITKSPSPTRAGHKYRPNTATASIQKQTTHSPRKDRVTAFRHSRNSVRPGFVDVQPLQSPEHMPQLPSPEILRQEQEQLSPIVSPIQPQMDESRDPDPSRQMFNRSPLFNKPTYHERFSDLPVIFHEDRNRAEAVRKVGFRPVTLQDQAQQTDYDYHYYDKSWHSPYFSRWKDCSCLSDHHLSYQCSCPYCPCYWRYRLASPSGYHHWRTFHHDLAGLYDDLYRQIPHL